MNCPVLSSAFEQQFIDIVSVSILQNVYYHWQDSTTKMQSRGDDAGLQKAGSARYPTRAILQVLSVARM